MSIIKVKLYGEFALFNDVVANVERYSYPVPTFSAVKGILESIYWKPEFTWQVISVQVLNEIKRLCTVDFPEVPWLFNEDGSFRLK